VQRQLAAGRQGGQEDPLALLEVEAQWLDVDARRDEVLEQRDLVDVTVRSSPWGRETSGSGAPLVVRAGPGETAVVIGGSSRDVCLRIDYFISADDFITVERTSRPV
jgi:hypothetical protein